MQSNQIEIGKRSSIRPTGSVAPLASQDIEDFIYLISHDVRGSVRALLELPQWIAEDLQESGIEISGQVAASIELMNRHTGRLDRMLVDLLAFSRIGRLQAAATVSLCRAIDEVLEQVEIPSGFQLDRTINCTELVMGERDFLTLLSALVSNAIKHHDRASGRLLVASEKVEDQIVISVSDDGPGIEEQFHERAFAPMTTLRPRDEVEGSGMGLANVAKVAAHYGGAVRLVPSPFGRGTRIEVQLPVRNHA